MSSTLLFGVNLDDPWRYAGLREPKSIIFPHLISIGLPESKILDTIDEFVAKLHGDSEEKSQDIPAILSLADMLADLKIDFVRCWFPWNFFEREAGEMKELNKWQDASYNEYPLDNLVETLTRKGISVVPVVACGYQRMLPKGLNPDSAPNEYIKRGYFHTRLLVRHYKKFIHTWQIENEPNWWHMHTVAGWRSGAVWLEGAFAEELLGMLNDAVHEEDPDATTIINLEADKQDLNVIKYSKYCDRIGLDFYPNYRLAYPINVSILSRAEAIYKETGKEVIISETGYPSGPSILGYNEQRQAEYVRSACSSALSMDHVKAIAIWRYRDSTWRSFPEQENYFGLLDTYERPKIAWRAYSDIIHTNRR
ncbi:MAG: hypothetical protein QXG05_08400 [Nitrososphaerota archaeon]